MVELTRLQYKELLSLVDNDIGKADEIATLVESWFSEKPPVRIERTKEELSDERIERTQDTKRWVLNGYGKNTSSIWGIS